jgi:hypothetical protein
MIIILYGGAPQQVRKASWRRKWWIKVNYKANNAAPERKLRNSAHEFFFIKL